MATRKAENLTPGRFDESLPSWSPDGSRIAFYSNRNEDPDRNNEFGLYTIEPRPARTPKLLTKFQGDAGDSSWMSAADLVGPMAVRSLSSPPAIPSSFSISTHSSRSGVRRRAALSHSHARSWIAM